MRDKPIIAVDFDGVLHIDMPGTPFNPVPPNGPEPHGFPMVMSFIEMGYEVVIHTTRGGDAECKRHVEEWLAKHGFPKLRVTDRKIKAKIYVDDRARRYDGSATTATSIIRHAKEIIGGKDK